MLCAGDLRWQVVFQRNTPGADNAYGEAEENWAELATRRAKRVDVRDSEKFKADQVSGAIMARFFVRWDLVIDTLKTSDRLVHDGLIWEILGIKQPANEMRNTWVEVTAAARND